MSAIAVTNASILVSLLLGLLDRTQEIGQLLAKVHSENRDVTTAELDALFAGDDAARATLQAAIDRARANQVPPKA